MKLREILHQVDVMVSNSLSPDIKIAWINQIQNEFYRDYPVPDAVYPFVTDGGNLYELPPDCAEDRIQQLVIDKKPYMFVPVVLETTRGRFFTVVTDAIVVYPTPRKGLDGMLYYRPRPVVLTTDDLDAVPTFPHDFIEMLVLGCATRVAKVIGETEKAQIFDADFMLLAEKARRSLTKTKQRTINVVRRWR